MASKFVLFLLAVTLIGSVSAGEVYLFSGEINSNFEVTFDGPIHVGDGSEYTESEVYTDGYGLLFEVVFYSEGLEEKRFPFARVPFEELFLKGDSENFAFYVEVPEYTDEIGFEIDYMEKLRYEISENSPKIEDVIVSVGEDSYSLEWAGEDEDEDVLDYSYYYSYDLDNWNLLGFGEDNSMEIDKDYFEQEVYFKILGSDGFNIGSEVSYLFDLKSTQINSCSDISQSGFYSLIKSLEGISGRCLLINAPEVVFNGNGFTLSGDSVSGESGEDYGIKVENAINASVQNVSVKDFDYGIWFKNVEKGLIKDISASSNSGPRYSIFLQGSSVDLGGDLNLSDNMVLF